MKMIFGLVGLAYGLGFVAVAITRAIHLWDQVAPSAALTDALGHALLWPTLLVS